MARYSCVLPFAGHAVIEVEADSEVDAISKALEMPIDNDDIETWEVLERFHQGNVCYCPSPWKAEAIKISDDDEVSE